LASFRTKKRKRKWSESIFNVEIESIRSNVFAKFDTYVEMFDLTRLIYDRNRFLVVLVVDLTRKQW